MHIQIPNSEMEEEGARGKGHLLKDRQVDIVEGHVEERENRFGDNSVCHSPARLLAPESRAHFLRRCDLLH